MMISVLVPTPILSKINDGLGRLLSSIQGPVGWAYENACLVGSRVHVCARTLRTR